MSEPQDQKIVDKIRFLLRKTRRGSGTTEAEAKSAMDKAMELMIKHRIDKIRVDEAEEKDIRLGFNIVKERHETGRKRGYEDEFIMQIIGNCFMCRVLYSTSFEIVESRTKKTWDGHPKKVYRDTFVYVLVGDKEDVEIAKMVIDELYPIMRHLFARHLKERGITWNAVSCRSFLEGLTWTYCTDNRRQREEIALDMRDKYALVVQSKKEAIDEFVTNKVRTVRARASGPRDPYRSDSRAHNAGVASAKKLKFGVKKLN